MRCQEHVVGLDSGTDEETRQRKNRETEPSGKILVCKGLGGVSGVAGHTKRIEKIILTSE